MGRELRRVPVNWEHPRNRDGDYVGLFDEFYDDAVKSWKCEFVQWENKTHKDYDVECEYWEWAGDPPDRDSYLCPSLKEKPFTWYQVYETVSEGKPVSPPFATKEELAEYLTTKGDFWDQERGDKPWSKEGVKRFLKEEWAPSMMVQNGEAKRGYDV